MQRVCCASAIGDKQICSSCGTTSLVAIDKPKSRPLSPPPPPLLLKWPLYHPRRPSWAFTCDGSRWTGDIYGLWRPPIRRRRRVRRSRLAPPLLISRWPRWGAAWLHVRLGKSPLTGAEVCKGEAYTRGGILYPSLHVIARTPRGSRAVSFGNDNRRRGKIARQCWHRGAL